MPWSQLNSPPEVADICNSVSAHYGLVRLDFSEVMNTGLAPSPSLFTWDAYPVGNPTGCWWDGQTLVIDRATNTSYINSITYNGPDANLIAMNGLPVDGFTAMNTNGSCSAPLMGGTWLDIMKARYPEAYDPFLSP
jgi:hypothetical protein